MSKRIRSLLGSRRLVLQMIAFVAAITIVGTPLQNSVNWLKPDPPATIDVNWNSSGG